MKTWECLPHAVAILLLLSLLLAAGGCGMLDSVGGEGESDGGKTEEIEKNAQAAYPPFAAGQPVSYMYHGNITSEWKHDEEALAHMADAGRIENPQWNPGNTARNFEEANSNVSEKQVAGCYAVISGLKDAAVENVINQKIYDTYRELCAQTELPAYRGSKALEKTFVTKRIDIFPGEEACIGNLYSLSMRKLWSMERGESKDVASRIIIERRTMVFDLATGQLVPLRALFGDDVDYQAVVNQAVREALPVVPSEWQESYEHNGTHVYNSPHLSLIAAFEGIREDQPFVVNAEGICLFFDETDGEFETQTGTFSDLTLYYDDLKESAIYPLRFAATPKLYENEALGAALFPVNYQQVSEVKQEMRDGIPCKELLSYPKSLTEKEKSRYIDQTRREVLSWQQQWAEEHREELQRCERSYLTYRCNVGRTLAYYSVAHEVYGGYDDGNMGRSKYVVYEIDTGKEVAVEDLFLPSCDAKEVLLAHLQKAILELKGTELSAAEAEAAWPTREFLLYPNALHLKYIIDGELIVDYIPFRDIDCKGLRLFQ